MAKPEYSDPFSQFAAMFQQYKLPGFDVQAILDARRKDVEALAAANRVAFGGMEALRDKQLEILRRALGDFQTIAQQFAASPGKATTNPTEVVQKALHQALADMQDIAQKTQQAQTEAYAIVTKRIEEAAKELKSSMEQQQK
ncbi:phasin [Caballeronia sordidicola]|uniref:Phasin n=1 Tax=Caballeronia sordidicola TaxID=196367 RepID=A0A158FPA1_CABSO|nr:phasin family protein [Caballeronia sordidicola]SAL21632.1 phasin [Caballeronia sordidicola]